MPQRVLLKANIARDRAKGVLSSRIIDHYAAIVTPGAAPLKRAFDRADLEWEAKGAGDALCRGTTSYNPTKVPLASVMRVDLFIVHNTNIPINSRSSSTYLTQLREQPDLARKSQRGPLRGDRNVFWLTIHAALVAALIQEDEGDVPDRARSLLGLTFGANAHLMALVFPRRYFDTVFIPTFVDAGPHEAFRNWDDEHGGVGYTWDLGKNTPGVPEIVTKDHTLDHRAEPIYLGLTQTPAPPTKVR
jgi:hypothetical protein